MKTNSTIPANTSATAPLALDVVPEATPTGSSIYSKEQARRNYLQKVSQDLQPISRNDWVSVCGRRYKDPSWKKFSDGTVSKPRQLRCNNLLRCPDCAARVTALQAKALGDALQALSGALVLVTVTLAHSSKTPISVQLQRIALMWSHLTRGRGYSDLKKKYGLSGSYKTLECTWSEEEGFHVHTHSIMILDQDADVDEFRDDWLALWRGTAKKLGYRAEKKRQDVQAVDRSEARTAVQYVTKVRYPASALVKAAEGDAAAVRAWSAWSAAIADLRTRSTQPSGVLRPWNKRPSAPEVVEEVQVIPEVAVVMQALDPGLVDAVAETLRVHGAVVAVEFLRLHGYPAKAIVHRRPWWSRLRDLVSSWKANS